jgi:hypothetical protein
VTTSEGITLAAVVVTALATAVLAYLTKRLVDENKKMVAENNRLIAAAEMEAKASLATVEEIRHNRELEFRPYLTFEITNSTPDDPYSHGNPPPPISSSNTDKVHFVNFGRGPAISAVFCELLGTSWRRTQVFEVSPNEAHDLDATRHPSQYQPSGDLLKGIDPPTGRQVAMFCEDLFGNRFRFNPRVADADMWRPGEPESGWAKWYAEQKFLD